AVRMRERELEPLRGQLTSDAYSAKKRPEGLDRLETCREALGGVSLDSLASDLAALVRDPLTALRGRRQKLNGGLDTGRGTAAKAATDFTLAEERHRTSYAALQAAVCARDAELAR